ncbi:MAG: 50S ribosomal protein L23 [Candidatus Pacebacteria bacterium]|nr:50S ribosomal protein L23 [Candidatus Paceibacterota bacterium]
MAKKELVKETKVKSVAKKDSVIVSEHFNMIKKPCITEKASFLAESNFYTFEIDKRFNKIEVKDFIERKYNVHVELVRIINVPKKPKKRGLIKGFRSGFKKAIVRVKAGEQIDLTSK